ncbi:MAG: cytidine deaminase, partial [Acholeplasmataceae bacterium]
FSAYSQGYKKDDIIAIAIVADTKDVVSPCGACRQVMIELINEDVPIYLGNTKEKVKEVKINDLLPCSFKEVEL